MSENYEDFSIKLFGKMIQVGSNINEDFVGASVYEPSSAAANRDDFEYDCESTCDQNLLCSKQNKNRGNEENIITKEAMETKQEGELSSTSVLDEPKTPTTPSTDTEKPKTCNNDKVCSSHDLANINQDQSDQASSDSDSQDQNPLKKPDKIVPCARCSSMDTKFCYYNNYNVNQPRHFCKSCQRYWTAGGSMRNVPVGAGRRKNKSSAAAAYRNLLIPGASDGLMHQMMRPDGTVLAFGNDNSSPNSNNSSVSFSNPNMISLNQANYNGGTMANSQPIPCFPYSWNPVSWQSGFPVSFYTASAPQWGDSIPAGPCNLQWVPTQSLNSDQSSTSSSLNNSTSLGKHPREGRALGSSNTDNNKSYNDKELENPRVVMPRTLRINDPVEASKSSIWTTLGANNNNNDHNGSSSIGRVAFFGGLQQAKEVNNYERTNDISDVEASSMALQANPAAFSRSLAFHEIAQ